MSTITIIHSETQHSISVPYDSKFGTLRIQFEENDKTVEIPFVPRVLHDFFIKDIYVHKDSIKS